MSELMHERNSRKDFTWRLLTTASAAALLAAACGTSESKAADQTADRPTVWIELGGQLERPESEEEQFAPSFVLTTPRPAFETISPLSVERPPQYSFGGNGSLSFQPKGSDWVVSASVRFGRSNGGRGVHEQIYKPYVTIVNGAYTGKVPLVANKFADSKSHYDENNALIDFKVGRDVGLGMFGNQSESVFSLGVRFAQFGTKSNVALKSDPDFHVAYKYAFGDKFVQDEIFHSNEAHLTASRSFHGVGPSISWNGALPLVESAQDSEIALDWGINGAILFGRQKADVHRQTTLRYHPTNYVGYAATTGQTGADHHRAHAVVVPNVGGFAGVSFQYANAKVSFGYRGDFFFGAMDGGIDAAKKENVGFYGPFATISVGLGG